MIPGLGTPIEIGLAIAIYMIAFVLMTEFAKPEHIKGGRALLFSWMIGLIFYGFLALVGCYAVTWASAILFIIVTGLCNSAYKWTRLRELIKPIRDLRE